VCTNPTDDGGELSLIKGEEVREEIGVGYRNRDLREDCHGAREMTGKKQKRQKKVRTLGENIKGQGGVSS